MVNQKSLTSLCDNNQLLTGESFYAPVLFSTKQTQELQAGVLYTQWGNFSERLCEYFC